jgi:O-antigen/teichoic acid export membrane protein
MNSPLDRHITRNLSYRRILRSTSIIGSASVINIVFGILRIKIAAILLGPAGLGLIGLLQSLMAAASAAAALGFGTVGTRQIAEASGRGDAHELAVARRALFLGTLMLAAAGGLLFWTLRHVLAAQVLHDPALSAAVGWLAVGVALTVASGSQGALLNGLRRIGDLARLSVGSALVASVVGVLVLWVWETRGVVAFVLTAPLTSFIFGHWYVAKLPPIDRVATPIRLLATQWMTLARLGMAFMVTGVLWSVGHLVVRSMIQRELGTDALGHFQASWIIATTYLGVVLAAMGTDYYPRLAAVIDDYEAANQLVNDQTDVALLLAGPLFLALVGLSPWVIELLYSDKFGNAVTLLRWQVLGDVLKVVSWPLSYVVLAAGDGRTYLLTEALAVGVFTLVTWICLPFLGIESAGIAFLCIYLVCLPLLYVVARRRTGFRWKSGLLVHLFVNVVLVVLVFVVAEYSKWFGAALGGIAAVTLGLYGFARLANMADLKGPLRHVAHFSERVMAKTGAWRD